jgi:predicted DNA-binding protein with PD1-like motif
MFEAFIERCRVGTLHLARFCPGQDLFADLSHAASIKGVRRMVIVSGIGTVRDVQLRNLREGAALPVDASVWEARSEPGPFTILSLVGNLTPMGGADTSLRLHVTLGRPDGSVIGGQLDAATVFATVEVYFAEVAESWAIRKFDEETGLAEMTIASFRRPE